VGFIIPPLFVKSLTNYKKGGIVSVRYITFLSICYLVFLLSCSEKSDSVIIQKKTFPFSGGSEVILDENDCYELGSNFYYNSDENAVFATYRNNTNRAYGSTVFKIKCDGSGNVDFLLGKRGQAPFEIMRNISGFHIFDNNLFVKDGKNIKVFDLQGEPVTEFSKTVFGLDFILMMES